MPILGKHAADRLNTRAIDAYIRRRIDRDGVKRATVSAEIRLLKAAYSWAQSQEPPLIRRNLIAAYKLKTGTNEKEVPLPPTLDEIRRILSHAEPHLARAIKILWHCGIRPGGELQRLKWEHVDFDNREIRVYSAHKGGPVIRTVPMSAGLESDLRQWLREDTVRKGSNVWSLAIVHYQGHPVKSLKRSWKTAKTCAKITRKIRPYDLRHAFASTALRLGVDLKSVSEVLGHSRADTTLREYQHVTRDQHRAVVDSIPPAEDLGTIRSIVPMKRINKAINSTT